MSSMQSAVPLEDFPQFTITKYEIVRYTVNTEPRLDSLTGVFSLATTSMEARVDIQTGGFEIDVRVFLRRIKSVKFFISKT